ncbi:hypothetical protein BCR36DRAFT_253908, partial [Piromyces finnis]
INYKDSNMLVRGYESSVEIYNSNFQNMVTRNSYPALMDLKGNSYGLIEKSNINLIKLNGCGLVDDEANYSFNKINFFKITTSSKALITSYHRNLKLEHCNFNNIICNGDENSSIIYYDSEDSERSFKIYNSTFSDSTINGPLIKIKGDNNNIEIEKLKINNVVTFGPSIENISLNV